jgi:hypothetical protein
MPFRPLLLSSVLFAAAAFGAEKARQESVGSLDFFGLRRVTEAEVRAKLKIKEGDVFQRSEVKARVGELETIPGVRRVTLTPITVDGSGKLKIFVGIQEEGSRGFTLRKRPTGTHRLPEELAQIYHEFGAALGPAVRAGNATEDHSQGHSLSANPEMRKVQEAAVVALKTHQAVVEEVLKSSSHDDDRRAAAWLLGYARDKKAITPALVDAARDADSSVRNNATRALGVIATYAAAHPNLGITIDPAVFLEMLGSVTWTDRNKVSFLLDGMTKNNPELLRTLRAQALPELIEIARWKSEGHAFPAIRILGRIAGWDDQRTMRAAAEGGLEKIIMAATAAK